MRLSVAASLLFLSFHVQSNGVNASGLCRKESNADYKCGSARGMAPYWPVTTTCTQNKCCCHVQNGWEGNATYQERTCIDQDNSVIGCFACSGKFACRNLDNTHVGDSSCTGWEACRKVHDAIIGISSCNKNFACYQAAGTTIGNGSCNAESICRDCESGSVVPDGTCNDYSHDDDEVGTLTTGYYAGNKRCRACFAELRQGDYAVEVAASSSTVRRRLTSSSSSARGTLRAMAESDGVDSHCSSLAQEVKEHVFDSLSSHKGFVHFLMDKDLSKKCREEYLSSAIGVRHDEGIFDEGCKLTIKMNAKLELLKEDVPEFVARFKEAVVDSLPMDIVVDEVMATKMMNCEEDSSRGPGGKSKKGKSAKSKTGKGDKK